jgi:hypothetical protein
LRPGPAYPIDPDSSLGCDRHGHRWEKYGDCRHCPANIEDLEPEEQIPIPDLFVIP